MTQPPPQQTRHVDADRAAKVAAQIAALGKVAKELEQFVGSYTTFLTQTANELQKELAAMIVVVQQPVSHQPPPLQLAYPQPSSPQSGLTLSTVKPDLLRATIRNAMHAHPRGIAIHALTRTVATQLKIDRIHKGEGSMVGTIVRDELNAKQLPAPYRDYHGPRFWILSA